MKILIDANIIIYSVQKEQKSLRKWLKDYVLVVSSITHLEVLGYHKITPELIDKMKQFFSNCDVIDISDEIINTAIILRQQKSMSVCDAIIAATSLEENLKLVTANVRDFKHINKLDLFNPIDL